MNKKSWDSLTWWLAYPFHCSILTVGYHIADGRWYILAHLRVVIQLHDVSLRGAWEMRTGMEFRQLNEVNGFVFPIVSSRFYS